MTRRAVWLLAGAVALVLIVGAGLWIWQSTSRPASTEDTALAYLHALESGDAEALTAVSAAASNAALTAFAAADARIQEVALTSVDQSGDTATAEVLFVLGGEQHAASLSLSHTDGRWRVDASGLGSVRAEASAGGFVAIGDATFALGEEIALFPAVYTIAVAPRGLLDGETDAIVLPGGSVQAALDVTLLPAATEAAQSALDEHLAQCTEGGDVIPSGCGIRIPWGTEFRAVSEYRYRIEQLPTIVLDGTGFRADEGVLVSTLTGTGQDGTERTTTYRTDSWSVRGEISFTVDDLVVTVW